MSNPAPQQRVSPGPTDRFRIVFAGSGGQGVITASIVLAEAAVFLEGANAVQTQMYGPEARGGVTRSDLIISASEINFPKVTQPNILVALSQAAYDRYAAIIRPGGLLLTDSHFVTLKTNIDARQRELPFHRTVVERLGSPQSQNICMLGALATITSIVRPDSLRATVERRFARKGLDANRSALALGLELGAGYTWS
jgi:2-oxoglutarate ferredoxin oxidoreductase subunit gamma